MGSHLVWELILFFCCCVLLLGKLSYEIVHQALNLIIISVMLMVYLTRAFRSFSKFSKFSSCWSVTYIWQKMLNRMPFLNVQIIHENREFTTSVYRKSTFSRIYTNFEILLPSAYNFDTVYISAHRCFRVCSGRTKLQTECGHYKLIRCFKKAMKEIICKKLMSFL